MSFSRLLCLSGAVGRPAADLIYLQLFRLRHLSQCPTSHCSTLPGLGLGPPDGSGFQVHEK